MYFPAPQSEEKCDTLKLLSSVVETILKLVISYILHENGQQLLMTKAFWAQEN